MEQAIGAADAGQANANPEVTKQLLTKFQGLYWSTMQAVCKNGGTFTSSKGELHDFTSLGLTEGVWKACHRTGQGCRDGMVDAVRAAVRARVEVGIEEPDVQEKITDTDVPSDATDHEGSSPPTATPKVSTPSMEVPSQYRDLFATIVGMHVGTLKAVCNNGGKHTSKKTKTKEAQPYDFSAFGFSAAVWKACAASGPGAQSRMVVAIATQLRSGQTKLPDSGLRGLIKEVREAADVGNLRDEELASLASARPVDCSHDLTEVGVERTAIEVRRLVKLLNRFAFRVVYWNHGKASKDKLPDVWASFRRHLRCAHGDDDLPEVLVVCEVEEEVQDAIVHKGYTAIKSNAYTTARHKVSVPAGFEVTVFLRNGHCTLIDDSTGREDRYVTAAVTFPKAPESVKDVPFSLLGVHLNWKVSGKRDRYPKLMDWFAGVHAAGMPLLLVGDFNTHSFRFLDDAKNAFTKMDAQRRNNNVDVVYMHMCNATCVSDASITVEKQAHPLLALRVFLDDRR